MDCEAVKVKGRDIISSTPKQDREYKVKTYDFRRPDKFPLDQIRTVSIMHETFARLTSASMSVQLRHKVRMHVKCVDQMTYEEFIRSIPNPTTMAVLNLNPLKGPAVLEIDPNVSSSITDRLFGGQGKAMDVNRELSEIERTLMAGITVRMLENLKLSWRKIIDLSPQLGHIESNPQFAMIVPPTEMIILVSFEISVGDIKGFINFCIPFLTIEPVLGKLSAQWWYSPVRKSNEGLLSGQMISTLKMDSEILTKAEELNLKRLGTLKKGSLVKLEGFQNRQSSLRFGGETVLSTHFRIGRNNVTYTVDGEKDLLPEDVQGLLEDQRKDTNDLQLQENIRELSTQISKISVDLTNRIGELTSSQDHFNDQVFLQGSAEQLPSVKEDRPFAFIRHSDLQNLYQIIVNDHPQLNALILSHLESSLSAELLEMFQPEIQTDLIKRISRMERVAPEIIKEIKRVLEKSFNSIVENQVPELEGIEKITEILNLSSRAVEKNVIESLEIKENDLAEEIKKRMFVFEDIVLLDEDTVSRIVERSDLLDLCLSMKVAPEEVKSYIFNQISKDKNKEIVDRIDRIGRVKISDVDKAQQRIVALIRDMEENGEIIVCRPDEIVE